MMHDTSKANAVNRIELSTAANGALNAAMLAGAAAAETGKRRTLAGRIHAELRRRILCGAIEPGTRLVVDKLAREFDTSITPIREALRLLERDGLIENRPHRGATVTLPTEESFQELYDVRATLEPLATRRACGHLSDEDLAHLRRSIEIGERAAADEAEAHLWIDADHAFHALLWQRADNTLLERMLGQLMDIIQLHREMYFVSPTRVVQSVAEHRRILDALAACDADAAAQAMEDHMRSHVTLAS